MAPGIPSSAMLRRRRLRAACAATCLCVLGALQNPPGLGAISVGAPPERGSMRPGRGAAGHPGVALPFSSWDVIEFLSHNFQIKAEEISPGHFLLRFADSRMAVLRAEPIRMEVSGQDGRVDVTFSFREFNAMHYVAEFMECRLFERSEAEQLYASLYDPKGPAWKRLARFQVRAEFVRLQGGMQARFSFAPLEWPR